MSIDGKMDGVEMECKQNLEENIECIATCTNSTSENKCTIISEGLAEVEVIDSKNVFYNPVQEFNRDISVAVLNLVAEDCIKKNKEKQSTSTKAEQNEIESIVIDHVCQPEPGKKYEDGIRILEALSASGLRGIRYAKEIAGVKEVVANDLSESAVTTIRKNIIRNGVEHLMSATHSDAALLMYQHRRISDRFDAIDLDPYGCPSQFLDAAVQSVADRGVLLVTCTDMAVLAGNSPETCYVKYGSVSLRTRACHEMALRIVLQCIEAHANRYGRYIEPLVSFSVDFYVRVVVRVFSGPSKCKFTTSKLAMVYQCTGCETVTLQPLGVCRKTEKGHTKFALPTGPAVAECCQHCNHKHHMGGPIWAGPLHSLEFLQRLSTWHGLEKLGTAKRLQGVLAVMEEELMNVPLYYTVDRLCSILHLESIPMLTLRSALLNAGHEVSYSHANRMSLKTTAPMSVIWHIMQAWEKLHPAKKDRLADDSPARAIFEKIHGDFVVNFSAHPNANPQSRRIGLSRFQENPTAFWGPGTRSQSRVAGADIQEKSRKNQGKNQHKRSRGDLSSSVEENPEKQMKQDSG